MNERLTPSEYISVFKPIRIIDLLDRKLPEQKSIQTGKEAEYEALSKLLLLPCVIRSHERAEDYVVTIAPPLRGTEISGISHFAAPNKRFGYDSQDFLNDAHTLFNPSSPYEHERLKNHRDFKNWHYFERVKDRLVHAVDTDFGRNKTKNPYPLVPIIQLVNSHLGTRFEFDLHPHIVNKVTTEQPPDGFTIDSFLPELGPCLVAAYSPDITKSWPERDTYSDGCNAKQSIAATQAVAYTIGRSDELVDSPLVKNLLSYCKVGD